MSTTIEVHVGYCSYQVCYNPEPVLMLTLVPRDIIAMGLRYVLTTKLKHGNHIKYYDRYPCSEFIDIIQPIQNATGTVQYMKQEQQHAHIHVYPLTL